MLKADRQYSEKIKTEQGKEGQECLNGLEGMAVSKGLTEKVRSGKRFAGGEGQIGKECIRLRE